MSAKKLKILLYDIETEPHLGYTWGKWEQNVIEFKNLGGMLSFAYKWLGEDKVYCVSRPDFRDKTDKSLVTALHKLLDEADIVIAHNGDAFDQKMSNVRFIDHGLTPPSPYISVDTKKVAKKYFRFTSNSLDELGQFLKLGRKVKHPGFQMWLDCMAGKKDAWKLMVKYNKQDVLLLEQVYLKLRPWIANHPNVINFYEKVNNCPKCGGESLKSCGIIQGKTTSYRLYRCTTCRGYCRGRKSEAGVNPGITN